MIIPKMPEEPKIIQEIKDNTRRICDRLGDEKYKEWTKAYQELGALRETMEKRHTDITKSMGNPTDFSELEKDEYGHYKIICPYCLHKFEIKDLLFRTKQREDAQGEVKDEDCFRDKKDEKYIEFCKSMGILQYDSMKGHILDMDPANEEIQSVTFITNKLGYQETVKYDENVRIRMFDNKTYSVTDKHGVSTSERICPECHNELPMDLGFSPNYIYALMGNSYCGKSVFLKRLVLSLLGGGIHGMHGIELDDSDMETRARNYFAGTEPAMADKIGYIPPIILRLQEMREGGLGEKFFVTLFDYPGEAMWKDNSFFNHLTQRVFTNSNGLIVMFDCSIYLEKLLNPKFVSFGGDDLYARAKASEVINRIFKTPFKAERVCNPVAMVVSKSDLIKFCIDDLKGTVWEDDPVFFREQASSEKIQMKDLHQCHLEINQFLEHFDPTAKTVAQAMCAGNHAWFAVSSTGVPLEDGKIPMEETIKGIRDVDPLKWLLYRNGRLLAEIAEEENDALWDWVAAFQSFDYGNLIKLKEDWEERLKEYNENVPGYIKELTKHTKLGRSNRIPPEHR